ncbi:MAG: hypothetical protein ACI4PC_03825 [Oscillospiraceae bacterium]
MKKRGFLFTLLIVAVIGVIAFLLIRLAPGASIDTPPVVLATPGATDSSGAGGPGAQGVQTVEVTPETVQAVIGSLSRTESYSRALTAESFWSGGSSTREIRVWVHGGNTRITESRDGQPEKYVLIKEGALWIWYADSREVYRGTAGDADADRYQSLLSYEDILELDLSQILDAGYEDYEGTGCIFVRYTQGELGYESLCRVSVDTGLPMSWETWDGDSLIYRMNSSPVELSTPDDRVFAEP